MCDDREETIVGEGCDNLVDSVFEKLGLLSKSASVDDLNQQPVTDNPRTALLFEPSTSYSTIQEDTMVLSEGPDKGHAWVIAIAAGVITMILSGISKMVGILYVGAIETYGVSRQEATMPFTLRKSLRCLLGPIVGIVGQRYGIRTVTLGGAVVAALGAALCFVAPTITWFTVCWGIIHGSGEAFANTLFQVVVNQYFVKYRSTASGIALSGACVGSVFFSYLIEALRDEYGLQGTFLVLAGIVLNVIPAAILLKSPSWINNPNKAPPKTFKESIKKRPRMYVIEDDCVKSNAQKKLSNVSLNPSMLAKEGVEKKQIIGDVNGSIKSHSALNLVEKKSEAKTGFDNNAFAVEKQNNTQKPPLEKRLSIQNVFDASEERLFDSVSLKIESQQKNVEEAENAKNTKEEDDDNKSMLKNVVAMLKLYRNPVFVLICLCMAIYVFTFIPIMTSAVDYGIDKGLPETFGKHLINAMALGDIIGRLCLGWVTDKDFISIPRYMTLALVLQGVILLLLPFTDTMATYLFFLALYVGTAGSMLVRLPVLVFKHVREEQHSIAMGCYGFASGIVPLFVPAVIGHFRDHLGSYDGMYYMLGILCIVSGGIWLFEPLLVRWNETLERRREDNDKV